MPSGANVKPETEFRILINAFSGQVLQMYHKIENEKLEIEVHNERRMPWDDISSMWSENPF
jgi:hypothetical protein